MNWIPYPRKPQIHPEVSPRERKGDGGAGLRHCSHGRRFEDQCDDCVREAIERENARSPGKLNPTERKSS